MEKHTESLSILLYLSLVIPELVVTSPSALTRGVRAYLLIVTFNGVVFVYYMDMLYISLDRLLSVLLHLRLGTGQHLLCTEPGTQHYAHTTL